MVAKEIWIMTKDSNAIKCLDSIVKKNNIINEPHLIYAGQGCLVYQLVIMASSQERLDDLLYKIGEYPLAPETVAIHTKCGKSYDEPFFEVI